MDKFVSFIFPQFHSYTRCLGAPIFLNLLKIFIKFCIVCYNFSVVVLLYVVVYFLVEIICSVPSIVLLLWLVFWQNSRYYFVQLLLLSKHLQLSRSLGYSLFYYTYCSFLFFSFFICCFTIYLLSIYSTPQHGLYFCSFIWINSFISSLTLQLQFLFFSYSHRYSYAAACTHIVMYSYNRYNIEQVLAVFQQTALPDLRACSLESW